MKMEMEIGMVQEASGLEYDQAASLVQRYLPKIGEPLWKQRIAANAAATLAAANEKNAEIAFFSGNEDSARKFQALSLAFRKISDLAEREVQYIFWKESQGM